MHTTVHRLSRITFALLKGIGYGLLTLLWLCVLASLGLWVAGSPAGLQLATLFLLGCLSLHVMCGLWPFRWFDGRANATDEEGT